MRIPTQAALIALVFSACGSPELDALEKEQAALKSQVEDLKTTVGVLRGEMVEAGLITGKQAKTRAAESAGGEGDEGSKRKGRGRSPKADAAEDEPGGGPPLPKNELSAELGFTATRTGTPPALPALTDMERLETPCGYKFVLRELQPLSDYPLNNAGFGKSGPVRLLENGEVLTPHASPELFEASCAGAFRHAGYAFFFSPKGTVEAAEKNSYTLGLAEEVPAPRGEDGRPLYWVYPGTTLTLTFARGWDPAWGEPNVVLQGRDVLPGASPATARIAGEEVTLPANERPAAFTIEETLEAPGAAFTIELSSPADGPYLVIGTLVVGNADSAVVVTSEEAFLAAKGDE